MTATISDSSSRAHGRVPVVSPASSGEKTQELADYQTGFRVQRTAFWLLAYVFFAVMLGPTLPSPLYVLYQAEWHFSAGILTPCCSTCAWTYCGGARVHGNGRRVPLARNGRAIAHDISR